MLRLFFWLGLFWLAACAPRPDRAALWVRLEAPAALSPELRVVGPGFERVLEGPGEHRLEGLAPGGYILEPLEKEGPDGYRYGGEAVRVFLEAGSRLTTTVTYRPLTGRLVLELGVSPPLEGFTPWAEVQRDGARVARVEGTRAHALGLPPGVYTVVAGPAPPRYRVSRAQQPVVVQAGREERLQVAYGLGFGTVVVRVEGPEGLVPEVVVVGPAGSTPVRQLGSTTLQQVAGSYRVEAQAVPLEGITYQPEVLGSPFELEDGATHTVTVRHRPADSALAVWLQGLAPGDRAALALRRGEAQVALREVGPETPQPVRFEGLPFGTYTLQAEGVRQGVYLDAELASTPRSATTTQEQPRANLTLDLVVRPYSGRAYVGGNGARDNTGWTANGQAVPPTRRGDDGAYWGNEQGLEPLGLPQAGLYRLRRDGPGNLYALYQFAAGQSQNRILRFSRAQLEAGALGEAGALRILGAATGERVVGGATLNNPTDLAFDAQGNLWVVNQAAGTIACIRAERLGGNGSLDRPNQLWAVELESPRALAFDRQGHLWVAGGYFLPGQQRAYLVRFPQPTCPASLYSGSPAALPPDVRLDLSQPTHPAGAFYQPSALALAPDGQSLFVADFGGGSDYYNSDPSCIANGSIDLNTLRETIIKVPLQGENLTPSATYRPVQVAKRLTAGPFNRDPVPPGQAPPDRGLQQAADLAFDSRGNLWVAANNNVEVDPDHPCYPTAGFVSGTLEQRQAQCGNPATAQVDCPGPLSRLLTDRRGRVYVLAAADLAGEAEGLVVVNPLAVLSGPPPGPPVGGVRPAVGFTGLLLHIPRSRPGTG
ncbi:hypothetical protein [Meiothermus sp. QL-1]|uniref:hypothetical protein n=1 Tax=Meiothermus sp. QL-1 TaxID=2058095 RepID=UPI0013143BF9|nr:hypothetical protein [Meiothermus sp. QL-1]